MEVKQAFEYAYFTLSKPVLRHFSNAPERINPEEQKDSDAGSYLGRIVSVKDDIVEYREWVASVWSVYSAPLITQVSPSVPTYASIANRHVHPGIFKTQGMTSQDASKRSTTWPRSRDLKGLSGKKNFRIIKRKI